MRVTTQRRIDACHAEIDRLVALERAWMQRHTPLLENSLLQTIRDAQLECAANSPTQRAQMRVATAHLRP